MSQGVYRTNRGRASWDHRLSRHERGYGNEWDKVRLAHITAHPLCAHCARVGRVTEGKHVDHIRPKSQGGAMLDPLNLQTLCVPCHEVKSALERGQTVKLGGDISGEPLDPTHHWNTP